MFEFRHLAYNVNTGEILNCTSGNTLKRAVAYTRNWDKAHGVYGQWRFCHDHGKKWNKEGLPVR